MSDSTIHLEIGRVESFFNKLTIFQLLIFLTNIVLNIIDYDFSAMCGWICVVVYVLVGRSNEMRVMQLEAILQSNVQDSIQKAIASIEVQKEVEHRKKLNERIFKLTDEINKLKAEK